MLCLLLVYKIKFKVVVQQRDSEPDHGLSESLTEADSSTAEERSEAQWVALLAIGGQSPLVVGALHVKTCRVIDLRLDPLGRVTQDLLSQNHENSACLKGSLVLTFANRGVLCESRRDCDSRGWLDPQRLTEAVLQVLHLHSSFVVVSFNDIVFYFFDWWQNLFQQLSTVFGVPCHVVDQIHGRVLNGFHASEEHAVQLVNQNSVITLVAVVCDQDRKQINKIFIFFVGGLLAAFCDQLSNQGLEPVNVPAESAVSRRD